jgi:branched-chain amino acid transport system permease protein
MRFGSARRLAWAPICVLLVTLGLVLPVYWVYLLSTVIISALVARSIGLVTSQAGIISLCQMSFAAIGGWAVSWLSLAWPAAPFPLLVLIGGALTAPIGLVMGFATARIRGVELAVVTLGFATALDLVLRQGSFPGVEAGTPVIPSAPFDDPRWFFLLSLALLLMLQGGILALNRTTLALTWTALRVSERSAAALGVRVGTAKASVFAIGALLAGVAGGLLAGQYGLLTTAVFSPLNSMVALATAVLCGASLFGGAMLAGVFAVFVPELLRRLGLPLDVAHGLLAIGAFDVLRRGGGGLVEQFTARLQDRDFQQARLSCDLSPRAAEPVVKESQQPSCLRIEGLTVNFGVDRVLDAVDFTVRRGEVHALIGPNGAGKSRLVDAVTGFLSTYEGEVRLNGELMNGLRAHDRARRGMRRTFQQMRAIEAITVDEYLRLAAGAAANERHAAVREFFGLPDGRLPVRLMDVASRRILEIAGAVASKPQVLLLDEPAAGLAEHESLALAMQIRRIPAEFGCAVLLIEHDMAFVRSASTRATMLDEGRVVNSGPVPDVLGSPRVIAAYLGKEVGE